MARSVARPQWRQGLSERIGQSPTSLMKAEDVQEIQGVILAVHRCNSRHVESVPVVEQFEGQIAWQGTVEVFDLIGHSKAKRAYAWTYRDGDQDKTCYGARYSTRRFAAECRQNGDCSKG